MKSCVRAEYAGLFYPSSKEELDELMELRLADNGKFGPDLSMFNIQGMIAPSGSYFYSAGVSVCGYRELTGRKYKKAIIIGTADFTSFPGIAMTEQECFESPYGDVKIALADMEKLKSDLNFNVNEMAFKKQHSIEVQLPFIGKFANHLQILPLILGNRVELGEVVPKLNQIIDEHTLIVVSSNLSHYLNADKARVVDKTTLSAILDQNSEDIMIKGEASAITGIAILNEIALLRGWTPMEMCTSNSAEVGDDPSSVIGYTSVLYRSLNEC